MTGFPMTLTAPTLLSSPSSPTADPPRRYAGLDGMRAVAVALVVIYHLFPVMLPGGFIGVDVFFVISGFLITSLLLREHARNGRIALVGFWRRRARRLLPALALVVLVCSSAALLVGGDVLVRLGAQVLGAATFSYNWVSLAGDGGYFSAATPELFRNFWSLAVEEQFYVVWPIVLPLFLLVPRAWARAGASVLLAAASAAWMAVLVTSGLGTPGGDLTRVYFGTDTHAFGILLGVALAFATTHVLSRPETSRPRWTGAVGAAAISGLVLLSFLAPVDGAVTFPGALVAASLLSAAAIIAGVWPGSRFGPALDAQPLRWIGDRSYGIYLWHWPILVLLLAGLQGTGAEAGVPGSVGLTALVLTLVAAELSYRFVETPVRRHGFRGSLRLLGRALRAGAGARIGAVTAGAVAIALVAGTGAAVAAAPTVSSGQAMVDAGQRALAEVDVPAAPAAPPTPEETATDAPEGAPPASGSSVPGVPGVPSGDSVPRPAPTAVAGDQISAIGDSVMLASAPALLERYPGIAVDAAVSRSAWAGPGILQQLADSGQLRPYVVLGLGTNGPVDRDALERMAAIAGPERTLILVNAFAPRDWIPGVNAELADFAATHPRVFIADWSGAITTKPELLAGDQIHPDSGGGTVFAEAVGQAVDRAEEHRALLAYEQELRAWRRAHFTVGREYE
ncbi:acyltransferase family protein [Microbacterium sp. ET2]|uniref:acyltransferase family protein n=1 Tax=Microbacterium albipurpureum TaxID=3050384 RepID=UPI00259C84BF|nr:acyltransferase family protein [Microbacterium sp. ET2 (Ac-2212)]WJL94608.1 acyltransferase family protein [Microbacterium sp. ET2 (Ac-2212)]